MRPIVMTIALVMTLSGIHDRVVVARAERASTRQTATQNSQAVQDSLRRFVVTLAVGDTQPGPMGEFTPSAAKALADLKDFLPYKTYRPLDTAYVIGLGGPHLQLRGIDGQQHEFYMRGEVESPRVTRISMLRLWVAPSQRTPVSALIDTSFKIETGETVVVGTSRLDGGKALILLVTAAPPKG